ncbi:beta-ketoacyl synthase N-terminal-like domain-containing protein [Uliginosibacterium sp. H3]|uniref:Beta-ketoacyl synthase N-terminal-like domain-containing protein n=1 Tax=Uliginosibacterium silvisoli TaxID=3114758 RepID=A0ABU6K2T6_9RHOO|nr:beta-ketoacyl synthase N-terminal-like domain-containing protein [Uliginosibacterium sp. H3]
MNSPAQPPLPHVHIAGRGLACALGSDLAESVAGLASGGYPARLTETAQGAIPCFTMEPPAPDTSAGWNARAREILCRVVREAGGDTIRHAPLFIASSSLNMGAIERGQPFRMDMQSAAEEIARWLEWQGPVHWISTACTSSLNALITAGRMMRSGYCDDALVLGVELANNFTLQGFAAMQLLSASAAQPLGATRDGLVLGEAVAAIRLSTARQRWALLGGASVVSDKDATGASQEAVVSCWQQALHASGLGTDGSVDVLKLQAAGSPGNDAIELAAVDATFVCPPALTSLKAYIGHTLGASGAAEIALLTASLEAGVWPAVRHAQDAALAHGLSKAAPASVARLLASIVGFGGSHASVVLQDSHTEPELPPAHASSPANAWEICGRSASALAEDWQQQLIKRLGQRPRRIGAWAEAGLHGALECMHAAGEVTLPAGDLLRITSLYGPMAATQQTLQTIREDGMAMPFGFLQSQPGQLPAIVAQALQWQGDARIANQRSPLSVLETACCEAGPQGMLIGWLEEARDAASAPGGQSGALPAYSFWLRLRPATPDAHLTFAPVTADDLQSCRYLRLGTQGLECAFA